MAKDASPVSVIREKAMDHRIKATGYAQSLMLVKTGESGLSRHDCMGINAYIG